MNGHRGSVSAASLERSSSCKVAGETRTRLLMLGGLRNGHSGPSLSYGGATSWLQELPAAARQLAIGQKIPRHREIGKQIVSALGISDVPPTSLLNVKHAHSSSDDDIKGLKLLLHDNLIKARSLGKGFDEIISAMDRSNQGGVSRKPSRNDGASGDRLHPLGPSDRNAPLCGGHVTKLASSSHPASLGLEVGLQKSVDRAKHGVPNKRVRTSMLDTDSRSNNFSRPAGSVDRNKGMFKVMNGSAALQSDVKDREFSTSVIDGWDLKMRKKRSGIKYDVSANAPARPDVDCEHEPKRGVQQRLLNDVRTRVNLTPGVRSSVREETTAACPAPLPKMTTSARGPRSSSSVLSKPTLSPSVLSKPSMSPSILSKPSVYTPRSVSPVDDNENNQFTNKPSSMTVLSSRKRSASSCSLSQTVTQWCGQRPQKITRNAGRGHHMPSTSMLEKAPPLDSAVIASGKLSESEEVSTAETKTKENVCQKATILVIPAKKNKVISDQFAGDGIRGKGGIGRGCTNLKDCLPSGSKKVNNVVAIKQMRSTRLRSGKIESKSRGSLQRKFPERKGFVRPQHVVNSPATNIPAESGDDHRELLAAAKGALDTSTAYSSPLWKEMAPIFSCLSLDDVLFLKQQGDGGCSKNIPSATTGAEDFKVISDVAMDGELEMDISDETSLPLTLRLCAAIIDCNEMGRLHSGMNGYKMDCVLEAEIKCNLNPLIKDGFPVVGRAATNSHRVTASKRYHDDLEVNEAVHAFQSDANGDLAINRNSSNVGLRNTGAVSVELQYSEMSLDHKILLELQSIGLAPEFQPGLIRGKYEISEEINRVEHICRDQPGLIQVEDELDEEINRLEDKLREQAKSKEKMIKKLTQAVVEDREVQERDFERLALDKLVLTAYAKYMVCRGSCSAGKNSASKLVKPNVLSFIKRVLARYYTYKETGRSCFCEPPFKDMFSLNSCSEDKVIEIFADNSISNTPAPPNLSGAETLGEAQRGNLLPEPSQTVDEMPTNKFRRKEVLINDVGSGSGSSIQGHAGLTGAISIGTKGKRSERDREGKAREPGSRNGPCLTGGRQAVAGAKSERKPKSKPKMKMTQLCVSKKPANLSSTNVPSSTKSSVMNVGSTENRDRIRVPSDEVNLSHLQLPELDAMEFSGDLDMQEHDLNSWFSIDDDGLLGDGLGLEIPMDDLSDLNMIA